MNRHKAIDASLGRVLLVEDEALIALELEDALLAGGASEVLRCASIAETMRELDGKTPDVVILDVHLADGNDGWALAALIDQLGARSPQFVFATGAPDDIPPEIAEMGMVFAKPYNPATLVAAIRDGGKRSAAKRTGGLLGRLRGAL
jgi:DNA-binding response OmpR family regulator